MTFLDYDPGDDYDPDYSGDLMYEVITGGETGFFGGDVINKRTADIIVSRGGSVIAVLEKQRKDCE